MANGQHSVKSIQKSNTAIKSFIATKFFYLNLFKFQTSFFNNLIISQL
jgi:hypothetical protein